MKDRIKFSDEMLAAVIDGRKTQTRRLIEPQPKVTEKRLRELDAWQDGYTLSEQVCTAWRHMGDDCPYGKAGDVIPFADKDGNIKGEIEIIDVWLQRVQEISQEDARAEGFEFTGWTPTYSDPDTRANAEVCLIATRGRGLERQSAGVRQIVYSCLGEHSEKPKEVHHRLEELYGDVPRIELFAREKYGEWDVYGDQVDGSVEIK